MVRTMDSEQDCERIAEFLEEGVRSTSVISLGELNELPKFGTEMQPTYLVISVTLFLCALKVWGKTPIADLPWAVLMSPYLIVAGVCHIISLRLKKRASDYIRKAVTTT
jgi:hypothetical protein